MKSIDRKTYVKVITDANIEDTKSDEESLFHDNNKKEVVKGLLYGRTKI